MGDETYTVKTEPHECSICGRTHDHTIRLYVFDMDERSWDSSETKGPVTLVVDEYGDWFAMADDGSTIEDQYWNSTENNVVIEVVPEEA